MITNIIPIGNSRGVRIPKVLLEESALPQKIELKVKKGEIRLIAASTGKKIAQPITLASQKSFAKDWLRKQEDDAWAVYQPGK